MKVDILSFDELSASVVYKILDIRNKVFVVEQNCVYNDTDFMDQVSLHVLIWDAASNLTAYCRILPPGTVYDHEASIGRVVTNPEVRGIGQGKKLMEIAIKYVRDHFKGYPIKIEAQSYLIAFYKSFGFEILGEEYLLDGIPHRRMILM